MTGHIQKKFIMNEDNNIIRVLSTSFMLLILMSDVFFYCIYLMRDVLLLLSTILYELWVK